MRIAGPLSALLALAPGAIAGTLYVDANLDTGLDDGSSWENAFQGTLGLRDALAVAALGDRVFAAEGTYQPALWAPFPSSHRYESLTIPDGVEVYGGFVGDETDPSERPLFGSAPSVLEGDLAGDGSSSSYSVVVVPPGAGTGTILDGFTVQGGYASNTNPFDLLDKGGGLKCIGSSPTVRNCRFRSNRALSRGGAAYVESGAARFLDCTFEDNLATHFGTAVALWTGEGGFLARCTFRSNGSDVGTQGGALSVTATSNVVVTECVFVDNVSTNSAPVYVYAGSTSVVLRGCTVVGNTSGTANAGLHFVNSSGSARNCILWGNTGNGVQDSEAQIEGLSASYCIVQGGTGSPFDAGILDVEPLFVDLVGGDLALQPGSAGVDAGNNSLVLPWVDADVTGAARFANDPYTNDTGVGSWPLVDMGAYELQEPVYASFCDDQDGSLASCPCGNPGAPESGCEIQQGTGGVRLDVSLQEAAQENRATLVGSGFPATGSPAAVALRAPALDPGAPVVFGDGLRCVGVPLVRLGATLATVGISNHTFGHGAMAGGWYYQLWFRNTPAAYCTPEAFNLSNGREMVW